MSDLCDQGYDHSELDARAKANDDLILQQVIHIHELETMTLLEQKHNRELAALVTTLQDKLSKCINSMFELKNKLAGGNNELPNS